MYCRLALVTRTLSMERSSGRVRSACSSSAGETLTGSEFEQLFGGKGANQAVAAALLGSSVRMVSKLGADSLGEVRASLTRLEVSLALLSC